MVVRMRHILSIFTVVAAGLVGKAAVTESWDTYSDTWVATDDLGREVYNCDSDSAQQVRRPSEVGMFYYLWHGHHIVNHNAIFDVTEILGRNPENPEWGDLQEMHWWGKPLLGYYQSGNPYIVAKHLQMLSDAGVDFLFFDVTNGPIYESSVRAVMREIDRRTAAGMKSPRLSFMCYWGGAHEVELLYNTFYSDSSNDRYWYYYQGRPLILANPADTLELNNPAIAQRFTFRRSWAWMKGKNPREWAWLEHYPQAPGYDSDPSVPEQLSVSVAQHASSKIGKSFHCGKQPPLNRYALTDSTSWGLYFEEQWKTAHRLHPPVLMITQFNEWTAQRYVVKDSADIKYARPLGKSEFGETMFVDTYNAEFNRDIEPSTHPLIRDNYYMQFVSHMHRYKGCRAIPCVGRSKIKAGADIRQWSAVQYEYRDDRVDTLCCNSPGYNRLDTIVNEYGRNDLIVAKVAHDKCNFHFYLRSSDPWRFEPSGTGVTLLIAAGDATNWHGYTHRIYINGSGEATVSRCSESGKYQWTPIASIPCRIEGNELQVAVPRKYLNGVAGHFDFKWIDNLADVCPQLDVLDFYIIGDVAPNARFNYRYKFYDNEK